MRVFLAGATGVIGVRLVPLLVGAGHQVAGMTRSQAKADQVAALGAEPVVCDVYDPGTLTQAVTAFRPDVVLHELTDLPDDAAQLGERRQANARMRVEGTDNLLAAARAAGAQRVLAQSIAWDSSGPGQAARAHLERSVLDLDGVVLRYGHFYGPGTYYDDGAPPPPRIHVDEAARRTIAALDAASGILEIVE